MGGTVPLINIYNVDNRISNFRTKSSFCEDQVRMEIKKTKIKLVRTEADKKAELARK